MLYLKRRRLLVWLVKAYLKKWGKTIILSFGVGLILFLIVVTNADYIISKLPIRSQDTVGIAGLYTRENLPPRVLDHLSRGLTKVEPDGSIKPDIAESWKIDNGGRTYVFKLRNNIFFSDKSRLTSDQISMEFADVNIERPSSSTIVFKLKEPYAPFLVTLSREVFKKGLIGTGDYKVSDIKFNGEFIQSIVVVPLGIKKPSIKYNFYPTQDALKTAYMLGEIDEASGLTDTKTEQTNLSVFKNTAISKNTNYQNLVTLFYNTQDSTLSDKRIRKALSYLVKDDLSYGKRNINSYSPLLWTNTPIYDIYKYDVARAKDLISETEAKSISLSMKTLPQFEPLAKELSQEWQKVNIKTKIEVVDSVPDTFQIFLGEFYLPKDPDQYVLWHSEQTTNITRYKNLRIDKLLEDGRKTIDTSERKRIYSDFQKYLLDDAPATFLYFPYVYDIKRK